MRAGPSRGRDRSAASDPNPPIACRTRRRRSRPATGSRLPFRVDRLDRLVPDRAPGGAVRLGADDQAGRRRRALEPRRRVDHVAGRERLAQLGPGAKPRRAPHPCSRPPELASCRPGCSAFSSPNASSTRSPARTARSASSPCATGAPNTATTASPMNFSTVAAEPLELVAGPLVVQRSSSRTSSGSAPRPAPSSRRDRRTAPTRACAPRWSRHVPARHRRTGRTARPLALSGRTWARRHPRSLGPGGGGAPADRG